MSALRASLLTPDRMREALSSAVFSYSSTGKPNDASPLTNAVHGSVAVTTVNCAPSCLARSKPAATALPASSDPSVAIRICLYIVVLLGVVGAPGHDLVHCVRWQHLL